MSPKPILIAHRGFSAAYPENTLLSYRKAYECGIKMVELDLQLTQDHVPVLHHDLSLQRMAGVDVDIHTLTFKEFIRYPASFSAQFGGQFSDNVPTAFSEFCLWLAQRPDVCAFIELKTESIEAFGADLFARQVWRCIQEAGVVSQCVIISFDISVLKASRQLSVMAVGWVLPEWSLVQQAQANDLQPEFLFCSRKRLPPNDGSLWPGLWEWVVYNIDDEATLALFSNRPRIRYLETNEAAKLVSLVESL